MGQADLENVLAVCPFCTKCDVCPEFQKLLQHESAGISIYRHSVPEETDTNDCGGSKGHPRYTFILENKRNEEITRDELVPAFKLDKDYILCPRCKKMYEHAQHLVKKISRIGKKTVMGVCDHCLKTVGRHVIPCTECEYAVKAFAHTRKLKDLEYLEESAQPKYFSNNQEFKKSISDRKTGRGDSKSDKHEKNDILAQAKDFLKNVYSQKQGIEHVSSDDEQFNLYSDSKKIPREHPLETHYYPNQKELGERDPSLKFTEKSPGKVKLESLLHVEDKETEIHGVQAKKKDHDKRSERPGVLFKEIVDKLESYEDVNTLDSFDIQVIKNYFQSKAKEHDQGDQLKKRDKTEQFKTKEVIVYDTETISRKIPEESKPDDIIISDISAKYAKESDGPYDQSDGIYDERKEYTIRPSDALKYKEFEKELPIEDGRKKRSSLKTYERDDDKDFGQPTGRVQNLRKDETKADKPFSYFFFEEKQSQIKREMEVSSSELIKYTQDKLRIKGEEQKRKTKELRNNKLRLEEPKYIEQASGDGKSDTSLEKGKTTADEDKKEQEKKEERFNVDQTNIEKDKLETRIKREKSSISKAAIEKDKPVEKKKVEQEKKVNKEKKTLPSIITKDKVTKERKEVDGKQKNVDKSRGMSSRDKTPESKKNKFEPQIKGKDIKSEKPEPRNKEMSQTPKKDEKEQKVLPVKKSPRPDTNVDAKESKHKKDTTMDKKEMTRKVDEVGKDEEVPLKISLPSATISDTNESKRKTNTTLDKKEMTRDIYTEAKSREVPIKKAPQPDLEAKESKGKESKDKKEDKEIPSKKATQPEATTKQTNTDGKDDKKTAMDKEKKEKSKSNKLEGDTKLPNAGRDSDKVASKPSDDMIFQLLKRGRPQKPNTEAVSEKKAAIKNLKKKKKIPRPAVIPLVEIHSESDIDLVLQSKKKEKTIQKRHLIMGSRLCKYVEPLIEHKETISHPPLYFETFYDDRNEPHLHTPDAGKNLRSVKEVVFT